MGKRVVFIALMLLSLASFTWGADKRFTLVIDAGHGGRDAGCVGSMSKEKNLTLKMALAFGKYVERNCPDVKVIYTRKTDVFLELWQRAEIANRNKADLFISIHINSLPGKKIAHGVQTYTLGRGRVSGSNKGISENLDVAKRENAVIVMEKDYKQHYAGFDPNSPESNIMFEFIQDTYRERSVELAKLMQQKVCAATGLQNGGAHQDNLAVLRLTSMPGCLLELGFISTPAEERFMNSADAPEKYSRGIYNAFMAYKKKYFGGTAVPFEETADQKVKIPSVVPQEYKEKAAQKAETTAKPKTPKQEEQPKIQKMVELPVTNNQEPAANPATANPVPKQEAVASPVPAAKQETAASPVPEAKQETAASPVPEAKQEPATNSQQERSEENQAEEAPVFKVQIMANSHLLKAGSAQLKGIADVDYYQEGGLYKYTVGASADYNEIYQLRKTLLEKFPEAFIIAFKHGQKIDVRQGIKEFRANKKK